MTQKVLPNGEEKFGPYLKFVMDEKEGSDEQYIKAFGLYLIKKHLLDKSPVFAEAKTEYEILKVLKDAETWDYPECFSNDRNCPGYYTGRTDDGSPVWIAETGIPDSSELLKHLPEILKLGDRTIIKATQVAAKSSIVREPRVHFRGAKVLVDLDGIQWKKILRPKLIRLGVRYAKRYIDVSDEVLDELVIINANDVVDFLLKKFHWLVSKILKKVKIYGQDKSVWMKELPKIFPARTLPVKYGGILDVPPLYAYQYAHKFREVVFAKDIRERNVLEE